MVRQVRLEGQNLPLSAEIKHKEHNLSRDKIPCTEFMTPKKSALNLRNLRDLREIIFSPADLADSADLAQRFIYVIDFVSEIRWK
jgi:hypothetical protein